MIKNKKFIANVHVSSIEREEKLPLWNTNTDSFIETHMTNNIFEIDAEDKHEVRRKVKALINKLQTKVQLSPSGRWGAPCRRASARRTRGSG